MSTTAVDWTSELPPLTACEVVPELPPVAELRAATDSAMELAGTGTAVAPSPDNSVFQSQQLYEAVLRCVSSQRSIPATCRLATALLITSIAMEEYVRSHSTRAKLVAAQQARAAKAAAIAAGAGAANGAASPLETGIPPGQVQPGVQNEGAPVVTTTGGGGGGGGDGDGLDPELRAFLRGASDEVVANQLLGVLGEPEHMRIPLLNIVRKHDRNALAAILQATLRAHVTGNNDRVDGQGKKSLGGVFFREVKSYSAKGKQTEVQQSLPALPPLRPYQRDVAGVVLTSWGLPLPRELLHVVAAAQGHEGDGGAGGGTVIKSTAELQERCCNLADGWVRNWLISAPTNSGKTRMFVEVIRGVVAAKSLGRCAVVVVLVPNVILTYQHKTYFDRARLPATVAAAFSSDNPLSLRAWQEVMRAASFGPAGGRASVVVCTAESFVNLLRRGEALLEQVDLLVLDEAHNCKDEHPYAQVMKFYNAAAAAATRVLAVTASPASERSQDALFLRMRELLDRLHARLYVVYDRHPDVAAVLPEPKQVEAHVAMRPVDRELMMVLQTFALNVTMELSEALSGASAVGLVACAAKMELLQQLDMAINACLANNGSVGQQLLVTRLDPLGQWLSKARDLAARYNCPNLELCCRFLDVMRKAIELVEDAGFEGALPFLARKAASLCRTEMKLLGGTFTRAPKLPPRPAATPNREVMFSAAAAATANGGAGGGPSRAAVPEPEMFSALRAAAAALPSPQEALAAGRGQVAGEAGAETPSNNSCGDIALRVSRLLRELLVGGGEVQLLSGPEADALVRDCFASGELKEESTFPKFWALVHYLQGYRDREAFHGIIFVKTRQAVFHVADMMRRTQQLQFLEVLELIGHNTAAKRSALTPEHDRHGRGMSDGEQQQVLRMFKAPGRKVLVATSAAEEGLDVPSCEFVVRYNAAATGIQLLQSRGRARRRVAEFFAILQEGTLDTGLHAKSRLEEANMRHYHRCHLEAQGRLPGQQWQ